MPFKGCHCQGFPLLLVFFSSFIYLFGVCVSFSLSPPSQLGRRRRHRRRLLFHLLPPIYRLLSGGEIDMATLFSQIVHPRRLPTPLTIYDRMDRQNGEWSFLMFVVLSATPLTFQIHSCATSAYFSSRFILLLLFFFFQSV